MAIFGGKMARLHSVAKSRRESPDFPSLDLAIDIAPNASKCRQRYSSLSFMVESPTQAMRGLAAKARIAASIIGCGSWCIVAKADPLRLGFMT